MALQIFHFQLKAKMSILRQRFCQVFVIFITYLVTSELLCDFFPVDAVDVKIATASNGI